MAWVSAGLVAFTALSVLAQDELHRDTLLGAVMFVAVASGFAITSLLQERGAKGISIAALVCGAITVLIALGAL